MTCDLWHLLYQKRPVSVSLLLLPPQSDHLLHQTPTPCSGREGLNTEGSLQPSEDEAWDLLSWASPLFNTLSRLQAQLPVCGSHGHWSPQWHRSAQDTPWKPGGHAARDTEEPSSDCSQTPPSLMQISCFYFTYNETGELAAFPIAAQVQSNKLAL